jgi:hypothetical protein
MSSEFPVATFENLKGQEVNANNQGEGTKQAKPHETSDKPAIKKSQSETRRSRVAAVRKFIDLLLPELLICLLL